MPIQGGRESGVLTVGWPVGPTLSNVEQNLE